MYVRRANKAVQGRQGAKGEWSRQAMCTRREGMNRTGEWPIQGPNGVPVPFWVTRLLQGII